MNEATKRIHACLLKCDVTFLLGFFSVSQVVNSQMTRKKLLKHLDWWSWDSRSFTFLECEFFMEGLRRKHS